MYEFLEKEKEEQERGKSNTGIPVQLKRKMEQSTGVSFEDVRVHYNSDKPEQLDALAYTKGSDVYLGQGQERHLPHELGHVVQQKLGYVHAESRHASGERLNTNPALERQADLIAAGGFRISHRGAAVEEVVQRMSVLVRVTKKNISKVKAEDEGKKVSVTKVRIGKQSEGRQHEREGWIVFKILRRYFTEECLEKVTMDKIENVLLRVRELLEKKKISGQDVLEAFEDGLQLNNGYRRKIITGNIKKGWKLRAEIKKICRILKWYNLLLGKEKKEAEDERSKDEAEKEGEGAKEGRSSKIKVAWPLIRRYKRKGWIIFQGLKKYFTEASLEEVTMGDIEHVLLRARDLLKKKVIELKDFLNVFADKLKLKGKFKENLSTFKMKKKWKFRTILRKICRILMRCKNLLQQNNKMEDGVLLQQVEREGKYKRYSKVSPYYNYKKMAMYCIAHYATTIETGDLKGDVGPHIAISVMGGRIYVANNTSFMKHRKKTPADMKELMKRIKVALTEIRKQNIESILSGRGEKMIEGVLFEGIGVKSDPDKKKLDKKKIQEIWEWIKKIRKYPIMIIDIPEQRNAEAVSTKRKPTHGEMTIMDYLENESSEGREKEIPGLPITTHSILRVRQQKLEEIKVGQKKDGMRRIIWFGGTRMDCRKCHEHFADLRDKIDGSYVVSSLHTTKDCFPGTEDGTHPENKSYGGQACVVASELEIDFDYINQQLNLSIEWLKIVVNIYGKVEEEDLSKEEIRFIDDLNRYLPYIMQNAHIVGNKNLEAKCAEIMEKVERISRLYLNMPKSNEEQASQAE